jgi:hypothetical protein
MRDLIFTREGGDRTFLQNALKYPSDNTELFSWWLLVRKYTFGGRRAVIKSKSP